MWWGSQAGMWVWLMLALTGMRLVRRALHAAPGAPAGVEGEVRSRRASIAAVAGTIAVLGAGGAVALAEGPDQDQGNYAPIGVVNARLGAVLRGSARTVVMVGSSGPRGFDFRTAADFALHRDGLRVLDPAAAVRLTPAYESTPRPTRPSCRFAHEGARVKGRVIAVVPPRQPAGRRDRRDARKGYRGAAGAAGARLRRGDRERGARPALHPAAGAGIPGFEAHRVPVSVVRTRPS